MKKKESGGIPGWAWCITWGIMILGVVLNVIALPMKFQLIPTPALQ